MNEINREMIASIEKILARGNTVEIRRKKMVLQSLK